VNVCRLQQRLGHPAAVKHLGLPCTAAVPCKLQGTRRVVRQPVRPAQLWHHRGSCDACHEGAPQLGGAECSATHDIAGGVFSKVISFFSPARSMAKEAGPMTLLMGLLVLGNVMFDASKDLMVVSVLTPEVIPFIQVCFVFPLSIFIVLRFKSMLKRYDRNQIFPMIIVGFIIVKLFAVHLLLPHALEFLRDAPPIELNAVSMIKNFVSFLVVGCSYAICELYGDVMIGVMFWGFAIQATPHSDAKWAFPLFGYGPNFAQILGGLVLQKVGKQCVGGIVQMQVCRWLSSRLCTALWQSESV
jgi:ATP/ADP translocase